MAQNVEFKLKFSLDGKEHIISTTDDVKQLAKELGIANVSGDKLRDSLLKFNNISTSFQNAAQGIQELTGTLLDLTDSYATQQVNETRLANNMRNTMDARDEDIQSIKDLTAAQQELGVIGDEVQLAGAQELATYLEKKSSLEALIPVMNDMLAQQYGMEVVDLSGYDVPPEIIQALTPEKVRISHVPDIRDVNKLIDLLKLLGVSVRQDVTATTESGRTFEFQADQVNLEVLQSAEFRAQAGALRGSIMLVGPLLSRFGEAVVPQPGGDKIGRRRLDTHFIGMERLGAEVEYKRGAYNVKAKRLKGCYMLLDEASVTGTANIVMSAVLARGTTTIMNAACEPYVYQLCKMLNSMGAKISGVGSNLLTIRGVRELHGCEHCLLPDMIEVGSFIGMAAMTQGDLIIKDAQVQHLGMIPQVFRRLGIEVWQKGDDLYVPSQEHYEIERFMDGSIMTIADAPWPGFTPDLISIALVVATQAKGSVLIHQKMFESRLFFVDKLIDMGAQIILCDPHRATVIGLNREHKLRGVRMASPDIRAGVALLIAALSAEGKSRIDNIEQIDRGYQHIDERLRRLGAEIIRVD